MLEIPKQGPHKPWMHPCLPTYSSNRSLFYLYKALKTSRSFLKRSLFYLYEDLKRLPSLSEEVHYKET